MKVVLMMCLICLHRLLPYCHNPLSAYSVICGNYLNCDDLSIP